MRAAILLAAGRSRRFGRGDKLLAKLGYRPVLRHALDCARASGAGRVIVVIPSAGGRIGRSVPPRDGIVPVVARRHRAGLAASLAAGLAALRPIEREVMIFLGDMPFARWPHRAKLAPGQQAIRPSWRGKPGHPLLVRTNVARAVPLAGDQGLAARLGAIGAIRGERGNLVDIDTPAALRRARHGRHKSPSRSS